MQEIKNDLRVLFKDLWFYLTRPFYRLFRGYDNRDLWGLDVYIARRILPGLKAFRKAKKHGFHPDLKTFKDWLKAIDDMIYGLEFILKENESNKPLKKENYKRAQRGRELLGKYLTSLWD